MPAPVASRRTADVLLGLALVVALTSVGLLALDRDPYLGYSFDPQITRAVAWVVLPGLGLFLALGTWAVVRLVGSPVAAWMCSRHWASCASRCAWWVRSRVCCWGWVWARPRLAACSSGSVSPWCW